MASVFKSYDIRGLCPKDLTEDLAKRIGAATARYLKAKTMVLGWDMRPTSVMLRDAFITGANSEGCGCIDLGMCTTPLTYWAVQHYEADGSVMMTGSHNPAQYNGMKICAAGPVALSYEGGLNEVEKLVLGDTLKFEPQDCDNKSVDPWEGYRAHLLSFAKNWKPYKIVVDAANGMGGIGVEKIFNEFKGEIVPMYFEPDGTFPNHEANPLNLECLNDLIARVKKEGADFGVAFDGDADRFALVDEKGGVVPCDLLTALFAEFLLKEEKGGGVIYDLRSSHVVPEVIAKNGGKVYRERVGHSHMKKTLRETEAIFGGELSGHFYFRDHANSDSGMLAFVFMLNFLSQGEKTLSELIDPFRIYHHSGEINFDIEDKDGMIEKISQRYNAGEKDYLDGLTVEFEDWWFNLRKSNTEPTLRLNLEADTAELCQEKLLELKEMLVE
jgi:phosphomannomutase